jgi:hypothetical protein
VFSLHTSAIWATGSAGRKRCVPVRGGEKVLEKRFRGGRDEREETESAPACAGGWAGSNLRNEYDQET